MKDLGALLSAAAPIRVLGPTAGQVAGLACDSRNVRPGFLFVAIQGEERDGHTFVNDAVSRGAAAVVVETAPDLARPGVCTIVVTDARVALARLACAFYDHPTHGLKVLGVTGTNGKTSTAYIARDILSAAHCNPGLIGTIEYRIGTRAIPASRTTPDALALQSFFAQMIAAGCKSVAMEVSSHALAQHRTHGVAFDAAVFTNLTRDHLDYHGDMDRYFAAKQMLFFGLDGQKGKTGTAVVNVDDPWGRRLLAALGPGVERLTYGTDPSADVRALDVVLDARGCRFSASTPWGELAVTSPLQGSYNVLNVLAAVSACAVMGVELDAMQAALRTPTPIPGRLESVPCRRGFSVFVDYAHTDDALVNVLAALRPLAKRRLIVVFGCGGDRDREKRPAMGKAVARFADYAVLTSDNPRSEDPGRIIEDILPGLNSHSDYTVSVDRRDAIRHAVQTAGPGDIVLIAGKGHERFQEFAHTTVPFDDRQVARESLDELS